MTNNHTFNQNYGKPKQNGGHGYGARVDRFGVTIRHRNDFKRSKLMPNFNGSGVTSKRVKSVGQCQICSEWFANSSLQVDHATPAGSIGNSWEGYFNWFYDLLADQSNMQLVCKPCHLIKTHADRLGVSFEEAKIKKANNCI